MIRAKGYIESSILIKYLLLSLASFFLVIEPLFRYDGIVLDPDYFYFVSTTIEDRFQETLQVYKLYRAMANYACHFFFNFIEPFQYKSYLAVFMFYLVYFILFEKIFGLLKIENHIRLTGFFYATSTFLILTSAFALSRIFMELISILVAWFFIYRIVNTESKNSRMLFIFIWGIVSILTYDLHFTFLVAVLWALNYVNIKQLFASGLVLLIFVSIAPISTPKVVTSPFQMFDGLSNIFYYLSIKGEELFYLTRFARPSDFILPILLSITVLFSLKYLSKNLDSQRVCKPNFIALFVSIGCIFFIYYGLSWPSNNTDISNNGKLNWNVVNMLWILFVILCFFFQTAKRSFMAFLYAPLLVMVIFSAVETRVLADHLESGEIKNLEKSNYGSVLVYFKDK
tara:strand:+ start:5035 stop:6231 length:1197 start_codon:yes stop_codon:yes gene_type:complete